MSRDEGLFSVYLRGLAMGAADVVPGVSGGTIAFITGIYERLIDAITAWRPANLVLLRRGHWRAFWRRVDGGFLLVLLAGIVTSLVLLARVIIAALERSPQLVWAFFSGLVLASIVHLLRKPGLLRAGRLPLFVVGVAVALLIVRLPGGALPLTPPWIFASGAIAICAMVLPGISGSFILLLLGMYAPTLAALTDGDWAYLGLFVLGCVCGLLSFTHLLRWLLHRWHDETIVLLAGFLLGSLPMLWPWQASVNGAAPRLLAPWDYLALTDRPSYLLACLLLAAAGAALVLALERFSAPARP